MYEYYFWYVEYKDFPEICSKKFDDFVEYSKTHAYSISFILKMLVEQNYNEY